RKSAKICCSCADKSCTVFIVVSWLSSRTRGKRILRHSSGQVCPGRGGPELEHSQTFFLFKTRSQLLIVFHPTERNSFNFLSTALHIPSWHLYFVSSPISWAYSKNHISKLEWNNRN